MRILVLAHYYWPHVGGVEKHAEEVNKRLRLKGINLTVLTEKYGQGLKDRDVKDGIEIIRFSYPHRRFFGLLAIWKFLWKNRILIKQSDIIQIHDVFIWYLPFRFLYPLKKVYTTIHGYESDAHFTQISIWQKRLGVALSTASIGVGKYLEKYLKVKFSRIVYGGAG